MRRRRPTQPKGEKEKEGSGHEHGQAGGAGGHHQGEGKVGCQGPWEDLLELGEGSE